MSIQFVSMWKIKLAVWVVLMVLGCLFCLFVMNAPITPFFLFLYAVLAAVVVLRAKA